MYNLGLKFSALVMLHLYALLKGKGIDQAWVNMNVSLDCKIEFYLIIYNILKESGDYSGEKVLSFVFLYSK